MFFFSSFIAAVVPAAFYVLFIWIMDKYDREPLRLVLLNFFWGSAGSVIFAMTGSLILEKGITAFIHDIKNPELIGPLVVAPVVEESTKGIFLLFTIARKEFDNITDGLVYGSAIGLGFGMTENFLYFISYGTDLATWVVLVITRSLFSAVMHGISTGTFGAFMAMAKFGKKGERIFYPAAGLILAMLIHFTWNFNVKESLTIFSGFIFIIFLAIVFLAVFRFSLWKEKEIIAAELQEEADNNLFPGVHIGQLVSAGFRKKGWIDERIRREYSKSLVTLAFRKMQFRNSYGKNEMFYRNEIDTCRNKIKTLLDNYY